MSNSFQNYIAQKGAPNPNKSCAQVSHIDSVVVVPPHLELNHQNQIISNDPPHL